MRTWLHALRLSLLSLTMAVVTAVVASAAVPPAPFYLSADLQNISPSGKSARLWWSMGRDSVNGGTTFDIDGYYVYESVDDGITYTRIATVTDSLQFQGTYSAPLAAAGTHLYYVTAYNGDGEGEASPTASVHAWSLEWVMINSNRYFDTIYTNREFSTIVTAMSSNNAAVEFDLGDAPPGVTLDESTGDLRFTPTEEGKYEIMVVARLASISGVSDTAMIYISAADSAWLNRPSVYFNCRCYNIMAEASVNEEYVNIVGATASNGEAVVHSLGSNAPYGMTIDASTGEIHWTPTATGMYDFYVEARLASDATVWAQLKYEITVRDSNSRVTLTGILMDSTYRPISGTVTAYRVVKANGMITYTEEATTVAQRGWFGFLNALRPGDYVLYAVPTDDSTVAPGYYRAGSVGSPTWDDATHVSPGRNDSIFFALPFVSGGGSNRLNGYIGDVGGTIESGKGGTLLGSKPLAGATVYAIAQGSNIHGYDITSATGNYEITGLRAGVYMILVDKIGYTKGISTVTFSSETEGERSADPIDLTPSQAVSSVPASPALVAAGVSIYPNPAVSTMQIRFNATSGSATVRMTTSTGEEILSRSVETVNGENRIELSAEGLQSGVFFLSIQNGSSSVSLPVMIVR